MLELKVFSCERRKGFCVVVEALEDRREITDLNWDVGECPLTWGQFSGLTSTLIRVLLTSGLFDSTDYILTVTVQDDITVSVYVCVCESEFPL